MQIWEIIILGVGLSMDAFAVAVCKGLSSEKFSVKAALIVGLWFGLFQAIMPLIGFYLTKLVAIYAEKYITMLDHWIAFVLLAFIGGKMIYEAIKGDDKQNASIAFMVMLPLAIGTSIDAMAAGVSIAAIEQGTNIFIAVSIIGAITFALSALGVKIGNIFGAKFKNKAEIFGGVVLILLGIKILVEGLIAG